MSVSIAKSGANLHLELSAETYDAMYCGSRDVGTGQVPLQPGSQPCFQVLVQADPQNGNFVSVGNESQGCHVRLAPGVIVVIPINDVSKIFVRAKSGTQTVHWLAMT